MRKRLLLSLFFLTLQIMVYAQNTTIKGRVSNLKNNEAIPFASIAIDGTSVGATSDENGNFSIQQVKPGLYNIAVSCIGFKNKMIFEVQVSKIKPSFLSIELEESSKQLQEIEVNASRFDKTVESPVSLRAIGSNEIRSAAGGNRDISKVIQSLPGVASSVSFRNDIIIRGGSPSENKFFLDGIEVPVINHFQTQGSSGGPVGMINVDLIDRVDFYSGAFPTNRGGSLSSVMDIKQKDGRSDRWGATATIGSSDMGFSTEGPISEKSSLILSARHSYLQFLFKALDLSFLPTYTDFQAKYKHKFDEKNELTILGLGAIDDFKLNMDANKTKAQRYTLNVLPVNSQWNYTIGAKYNHYRENGFYTLVLSRNQLHNESYKFKNNDDSRPENKLMDFNSEEIETKLRLEDFRKIEDFEITYGLGYKFAEYKVDNFFKQVITNQNPKPVEFSSSINLNQFAAFAQVNKDFLDDDLHLSFGLRTDFNDYSSSMSNPLEQLAPRFSAAYDIDDYWSLNFNTGIYYQLPAYTTLGYRETTSSNLKNKENGVKYLRSKHIVAGAEYRINSYTKMTLEGFYKAYDQYPFLVEDSISLANLGADFGVVGNREVTSDSEGRSYGLEFLLQQKFHKGFYGIMAYTLLKSEFHDKNGKYVPSSWDSRHLISLTGGKKFKKDWELSMRWSYNHGNPYTPYNVEETIKKTNWDVSGRGQVDYDDLNTARLDASHSLDIRVDKKFYFNKWNLNVYLDIRNLYGFEVEQQDRIDVVRGTDGLPVTDPNNPLNYLEG